MYTQYQPGGTSAGRPGTRAYVGASAEDALHVCGVSVEGGVGDGLLNQSLPQAVVDNSTMVAIARNRFTCLVHPFTFAANCALWVFVRQVSSFMLFS
jgi:hypothetical protein